MNVVSIVVCSIIGAAFIAYMAFNQHRKVLEWLKYAVTEAEKQFGEKTGQLKLRQVYDWFVAKFPVLAAVVPFRVFSAWVDVALETMRRWLEDNRNVANYVGGDTE